MKKKILLIAGTRPNFIKLAPLYHRLSSNPAFDAKICHTGQHFDFNMSDIFWQNLEIPAPDFQLNVKGDGVVDTIGKTLLGVNEVIKNNSFDLAIVFGDVNATAAGALAGAQSGIKVMHVEAGLRSFDRTMPEEVNRVITDHVADWLMVSEESGMTNLKKEGIDANKCRMVGNIMIESLLHTQSKWENIELPGSLAEFAKKNPVVMTFHRPENVDQKKNLERVVKIISTMAAEYPVIFPIHPRTKAKMEQFGLLQVLSQNNNILMTEPLSYFFFLKIVSMSALVITDSGGVQEETSFLHIPCVTFRKNTERPVTVELGSNLMMDIWDDEFEIKIRDHVKLQAKKKRTPIPLWDEKVSQRISEFISSHL